MSTTADLAARLVRKGREIEAASERLDQLKAEFNDMNRRLTEQFLLEKTQSMVVEVDGVVKNVHLKRQFWAKKKHDDVNGEAVYDALVASGLPELTTRGYSHNTLSGYLREKYREDPDFSIPEPLAKLVDFREHHQISITGK